MPTATLMKHNRLNIHGKLFENGKALPVDDALAKKLDEDGRFKIKWDTLTPRAASPAQEQKAAEADKQRGDMGTVRQDRPGKEKATVNNSEKMAAIKKALDEAPVDDDKIWLKNGKLDARYLSKMLGMQVTSAERDAAMAAQEKANKRPSTIKIKKATTAEPIDTGAEAAKAAETGEAEDTEVDETTKGAVET